MSIRTLWLAAPLLLVGAPAVAGDAREEPTIASLAERKVAIPAGGEIAGSASKARDNYREFLDLVSADPALRAEAMRRLADLELEAAQARQLDGAPGSARQEFEDAIALFQELLEAYPDYRRSDTVLYQLARAYEIGGKPEEALRVLDELVRRFPDTPLVAEVEFRRGEMLFLRRRYAEAEAAYARVVEAGAASRFYEQSLYKLGWSRFKLARHEDSLAPFFALLGRKTAVVAALGKSGSDPISTEMGSDPNLPDATASRAEQELVADALRVLSITFSYLDGPRTIAGYFERSGYPAYGHAIYRNLGELYLEKERYVDAAGTFEAFVTAHPWHAEAPLLQIRAIEAYRGGEFSERVLQGKQAFLERYGMDSPYWQHNPPESHPEVVAHVRENLTDLARYYHAEAQAGGTAADYREAARWYRRYLDWFPGDADSADTNFLLAEILFESGDFAGATLEYERTAYDYPRHARSAEAAYAAILARLEREKELEGEARAAWHGEYVESGLRFAGSYPEHPESAAVLTTIAEGLYRENEYDRAVTVGQAVVAKEPAVADALARTAWTVIAHAEFDRGNFAAAESAYYRLRPLTPNDDAQAVQALEERIASSIYKQGELARERGDMLAAVDHFMRVGRAVPESPIRATAEYDAAAALIGLGDWQRAAAVLEAFRRDHPESEFAGDVTQKLAVAYLESGRGLDAAREFETIAEAPGSSEQVRREALWKAAGLYRAGNETGEEAAVLGTIVKRYPHPIAESIEARVRLLELADARGDSRGRLALLEDLVRVDATAGDERSDRTRYLAAQAALDLADPVHRRFLAARITQPLAESLEVKKERMEAVLAAYGRAADYGVAEVTTAATYRLGEVYRQFARDLMESERPGELDAAALAQYELLLEEQAFPFEEKAIELYEANAARAADGVYDAWVQKSFAELAKLVPARYAKLERSEDAVLL
jgi:cellulose synthase operon protein C